MNHLYLIRHGENVANLTLEFSHRKVDYSLTSKGMLQAQQTANALRPLDIYAVYTSPLKRALETAQIIAAPHRLAAIPLEAFREINVGDLEGQKPTAALWAQHNDVLEAWKNGHPEAHFPGGEDYWSMLSRARQGFEAILSGVDGRNIVVVGHGGIFFMTLGEICEPFDRAALEGGIANCSITEVEAGMVDGKIKARLLAFGSTAHLSGDAANLVRGIPLQGDLE